MKIDTKYSLNDTVYYMEGNGVRRSYVAVISAKVTSRGTETHYGLANSQNNYEEDFLFKTKEELLKSL